MEPLSKILSYNVYGLLADLVNSLGNVWCVCLGKPKVVCKGGADIVQHPSYTIRHKYPKRLVTYDGEAKCEQRLIRFSDLEESDVDRCKAECKKKKNKEKSTKENRCKKEKEMDTDEDEDEYEEDEDEQFEEESEEEQSEDELSEVEPMEEDEEQCQNELPKLENNLNLRKFAQNLANPKATTDRYSSGQDCSENEPPDEKYFIEQEATAKELYQNWLCCCQPPQPGVLATSWESLPPAHQIRFYWLACTGEELQETPYENFKESYQKMFMHTFPIAGMKHLRRAMRRQWRSMDRCQRMPFILQALIYHVSTGDVDPSDQCAVRALFNRLRRRPSAKS